MGYTHGKQWTDIEIKERLMEVVHELGIDRMPSRQECEQYFNNTSLTNAITRRYGWYNLAKDMGLPLKDSETLFGKKYEEIAKEQLIALGYEVRRMPQNHPYDLLVEDSVKIDVKASRLYKGRDGNFFSFHIEKPFCTCDIYVLYLINSEGNANDATLIIPSAYIPTNTQISVGEKKSKYYRFLNKWNYISEYCEFLDGIKKSV